MFLLHHDLQTCLLIEMQMSESHRHVTALGRSVSRHCDRGHVTRIRTSVTHRQKPVRERQQFQPSWGHAALSLRHLLFFFPFRLRCSLRFLSRLAFVSPTSLHSVAHSPSSSLPPRMHTFTQAHPHTTGDWLCRVRLYYSSPLISSAAVPPWNVKSETWQLHIPLPRSFHSCICLHKCLS